MNALLALVVPSLQELVIFIVVLVICGVAWKFVEKYVGDGFKALVGAVAAIFAALWLLHLFGVI